MDKLTELTNLVKIHEENINKLNSSLEESKFTFFKKIDLKEGETFNISRVLSDKLLISLSLLYELEYLTPKQQKINSVEEMNKLVSEIITKFKYTFGFQHLDDKEWDFHDHQNTLKYEIDEKTIIYDNSICHANRYNGDIFNFVSKLSKYIGKLSDDIVCDFKYLTDKENDIINIAIICKLKN